MSRLIAISLLSLVSACASKAAAPAPANPQPAVATGDDAQPVCVETFTHNRTCTAEYIPALVDTRAKLDLPPGIAAQVKQDRAGVIAKATAEWATDSTDANITQRCQQMTAHMTGDGRALVSEARGCLAKTDCTAYVACIEPVEEKLMAHTDR